jgi:hypothetical protein
MAEKIQLVVGPCEVRFPNLEKTEEYGGVDTGKFSCTFMFAEDSDSIPAMKKAIAKANGGKGSNPLSQVAADAEYDSGMYKIKGKSKFKVKVMNALNEVIGPERVQGATVQAALSFAPYSQGTGGVTTYLNEIRVLAEGSGSGGSVDFGPVPKGFGAEVSSEDTIPF